MSTKTAAVSTDDTALDLIGPFVDSNDPYLRGNAVQALAVLAGTPDSGLASRAEELLAQALAAGPASVDPQWQRRFRARALDALRELDPAQREGVLKSVMRSHRRSTDRLQQTAVGMLLLEAIGSKLLSSTNWYGLNRLMASVGALNFWSVAWAVAWRAGLVFVAVITLIPKLPGDVLLDADQEVAQLSAFGVWALYPTLVMLTLVSYVGRPKLPVRYHVMEMAASGFALALICTVGTFILLHSVFDLSDVGEAFNLLGRAPSGQLLRLGILGFVVGAGVRLIKWMPMGESLAASRLRQIWAILVATVASMIAAWLGLAATNSGAAWIAMVLAAALVATLDIWLERKGPDLTASSGAPIWPWFVSLGCLVLLFVTIGYRNVGNMVSELSRKAIAKPAAAAVMIPEDLREGAIEREGSIPFSLTVKVNRDEPYTIHAKPYPETVDIALFAKATDKGSYSKKVDNNGPEQIEELTDNFPKGIYSVCVAQYVANSEIAHDNCGLNVGRVHFLNLASLVISGAPLPKQPSVKISIFRQGDRPKDLSLKTSPSPGGSLH
jgi:hypothetical protein